MNGDSWFRKFIIFMFCCRLSGIRLNITMDGDVSRIFPFFLWGFCSLGLCSGSEAPTLTVENKVKCPECGSERVWKDGIRYTRLGDVQRYLCRNCSYRFSC